MQDSDAEDRPLDHESPHKGPTNESVTDAELIAREQPAATDKHESLKYHLLGPSLTKAGQDSVDQQKVSKKYFDAGSMPC